MPIFGLDVFVNFLIFLIFFIFKYYIAVNSVPLKLILIALNSLIYK